MYAGNFSKQFSSGKASLQDCVLLSDMTDPELICGAGNELVDSVEGAAGGIEAVSVLLGI